MDENYESSVSETQKTTFEGQITRPDWVLRGILGVIVFFVLAVAGYSAYVAVHEPDLQETVVLGQTKIASGSPAALRVVVRNRVSGKPVKGAVVELSLADKVRSLKLGTFHTDGQGSFSEPLNIPEIPAGEYQLSLDTRSSLGSDHVVQRVEVVHRIRMFLTSDKPLYQPGQTIHLRGLAVNGRTQKPSVDESVTFEVKDPKGNKVFKQSVKSSKFGITAVDFVLASELNLGRYEICAIAGGAATTRAVEVKRYVLPKFKVQIITDRPYYLPGQTVRGTVVAGYFFGRPVIGGNVKLEADTLQEKPVCLTELKGTTDREGKYSFEFVLPDFFTGMPQKEQQAFLDLKVEVCDLAQHSEQKSLSLSVAQKELEIAVLPEAGAFVPGVENLFYIVTTYPDGRPAVAKIYFNGAVASSDPQGVTTIKVGSAEANRVMEIQAVDSTGKTARVSYQLDSKASAPAFLLRTDKAAYQAGQTAQLSLLSPEQENTVFIDVIKEDQTVMTRSVELKNHKATCELSLPASLVGALKIDAYVIDKDGEDKGCSRLIYVNPASGLKIASQLSKSVYRPGEIAQLNLTVTDAQGHPAPSALGICAVDESVYAVQENRPGLLQQFFEGEGELMKPRYQIKAFEFPGQFLSGPVENQTLAQAYFASLAAPQPGSGLEAMVKNGYLPEQLIKHAREMRGTPAFEKLRNDPRYAEVIRLLEGGETDHSFRAATGALKQSLVEAHRKAYFDKLGEFLKVAFVSLIFLSPILLLLFNLRPAAGIHPDDLEQKEATRYVQLAGSTYNRLSLLTVFPLFCYPAGVLLFEHWGHANACGFLLFGFEVVVVLFTLGLQIIQIDEGRSESEHREETTQLRFFASLFLGQFAVSRIGYVLLIFTPGGADYLLLWTVFSFIVPLIVLGNLSSRIRRNLSAKGVTPNVAQTSMVEVLAIMAILAILASMLLPALAKAKTKAQSLSLMNDFKQLELASRMAQEDGTDSNTSGSGQPRVRRDFPETLIWQPELITDEQGKASMEIPLADSITTWRASVEGISAAGKMGSTELPISVFQDFFVDLDLPVSLSLGDEIAVPVTCYNYLKKAQEIRLKVAAANWFEAPLRDLTVHLEPGEVKSVGLTLKVLEVGNHSLRVTAQGGNLSDAIEREIRVVPTGLKVENVQNSVLKGNWSSTFLLSAEAIPNSMSLGAKFYPSRFSEIVEGLDSIFQAPYGCFEQTSSTTYPNVLVLDYLKRTGRLSPEVEIKARKFINAGYQRLLTFEVPGGGFEWFGRTPAHVGLTAYGILEFTDMSHVHPVDSAMMDRTRDWLVSKQNMDGSWNQADGLDSWSREKPITAYVAWALAESGDHSKNIDKALEFLRAHPKELSTTYQKALAANAFLAHRKGDSFGIELVNQLQAAAMKSGDKMLHWHSEGSSLTYSYGEGMDVETTALCALALMKAELWPESVKQALTWISHNKAANGTWGSTQATILAMRALLAGSSSPLGQDFDSAVTVLLNGQAVETFHVNKENSDLMRQTDLTHFLKSGENQIEFRQSPAGELPFQLTSCYWLATSPKAASREPAAQEGLQIEVKYDRTSLAMNEQLKCDVTVKNQASQTVSMAIVDLGIPPGFEVDSTAFESLQSDGKIAKFEVTGDQVILYLREISNAMPFQFGYSLRARYPLRVESPPSVVYEYYQPKNRAVAKTSMLKARGE